MGLKEMENTLIKGVLWPFGIDYLPKSEIVEMVRGEHVSPKEDGMYLLRRRGTFFSARDVLVQKVPGPNELLVGRGRHYKEIARPEQANREVIVYVR